MIIGFSTPKHSVSPLPALIKWWDFYLSGTYYGASHAYTRFKSMSWQRDFIYQAKGTRTNFVSGQYFEKENAVIEEFEIPLPAEAEIKIGKLSVDREGTPYGLKQLIGQMITNLVYLITFKKVWVSNPFKDGERTVTCLEEMGYFIAEGLGIKVEIDLEGISIKEFRDWLETLPGAVKIKDKAA